MATPRSPSFFTNFFRAVRSCEPTTYRSIRYPPRSSTSHHYSGSFRSQSTYQNRYGPAATEGLPPPPKPQEPLDRKSADSKSSQESSPQSVQSSQAERQSQQEAEQQHTTAEESKESTPVPKDTAQTAYVLGSEPEAKTDEPLQNRELDMVLSVPSPNEVKEQRPRHPHLEPSPYEHHFDTYTLVQELAKEQDTFSSQQATTLMKAIRLMLTNNLDMAKEGLVSKSDVENESYLFRAACSELRTTLQSSRHSENQRQRTNRAQLQHEHDILNQRVGQDILNMKEELKGMFNDRKMGLQEEKRKIDTKISELNYEITVLLNSEAKSEVESLRWILTRRAAMAIVIAAVMTLSALQYYSVKSREASEIEKKKVAAQKMQEEKMKDTEIARYTTPSRDSGTQTAAFSETLG